MAVVLLTGVVLITIVIGSASAGMAYLYLDFAQNVPAAEDIGAFFGSASDPEFIPVRIYDRSGEHLLAEWGNPAANQRQWVSLDPGDQNSAPQLLIQAVIAAQDPRFWSARSVTPGDLAIRLIEDLVPSSSAGPPLTIAEQLAQTTLLPLQSYSDHSLRRDFRLALLGERLGARFDREQILTWYLNSADFGSQASGADAASLVYFGKHAHELSLAESALLASIPGNPGLNPFQAPHEAKSGQSRVLSEMLRLGYISQQQASVARSEVLVFAPELRQSASSLRTDLSSLVYERYRQTFGEDALGRGGVRIVTSIDYDLQLQAECTLESHVGRLSGESPGSTVPAEGDEPCLAAGFLPPLRPGDTNLNHGVDAGAAVVEDPTNGELLALASLPGVDGAGLSPHSAGQILSPFVYLTAFARGYAPGSMVLDLPQDGAVSPSELQAYHGPVLMRTALANVYPSAALRTLLMVGPDNVERTAHQLGLTAPKSEASPSDGMGTLTGEANLRDLVFAFGGLANMGKMTGTPLAPPAAGGEALSSRVMLRVDDAYGHPISDLHTSSRSVISPQLAYLVNDVLSDDEARWPTLGQGNVLDVGRPAAALTSIAPDKTGSWTIGYTPELVVGAWIGNQDDSPMTRVDRMNGAAPIWRALIQYASRSLPPSDWIQPPGMSKVEVCDPSGLLPTAYCPKVAKEVFIQGTEPTAQDNLYQPFKVDVDTGKLATLFTPLDRVREEVFLVPPPEALAWAQAAGIDQPPREYDAIDVNRPIDSQVHLTSPELFAEVGGEVRFRGSARAVGFKYYRLQYGKGLNPDQWVQIGQDRTRQVTNGALASWDTRGLNGLYTVQLLVVARDGQVKTDALPLTLDNLAPQVNVISPQANQTLLPDGQGRVRIECEVSDAHQVAKVTFAIDGRDVASLASPPFSILWKAGDGGKHTLIIHAFDAVGNEVTTESIPFSVSP
jgi:membrane peptidoglycan carboxypeptidase